MIYIKRKKRILLLLSLLFAALILSGCGGGSDGSETDLTSLNVKVKDMDSQGVPMVNLSIKDDSGINNAVTNDLGTASFSNLSLSENKIYQVKAEDYITKYADLTSGDDFVSIAFDRSDLILFDDFSDPDSGWPIRINDDPIRIEYVDGKYEVEINVLGKGQSLEWPNFHSRITDYVISADMELLRGDSAYGFSIDWPDNHIFIGIVSTENSKIIWVNENGNYLLEKGVSSYLSSGSSNNLMVVQEGVDTKIYLDGNSIGEISLSQVISDEAYIKVVVSSQNEGDYPIVAIDNFRLIDLQ